MKKVLLILSLPVFILAFRGGVPGGAVYPKNYFRSPVDHTILLSGTFGELRPNHFHAGIDIKSSKGVPGDRLYTTAGGYIARIKVEAGGYGRSLYINHPNGYTSLYAHLNNYSDEIEAYVKEQQYAQKSFDVDLIPGRDKFPVKQGQLAGQMGNTGASNGAHLHFEIRDTKTQNPINPLLFGFSVTDNVAPKMHALKVYSLDGKREEGNSRSFALYQSNGNYRIKNDTLTIDAWHAGFGLKVYDHFDRVSNWNGIYALAIYQNDSLIYAFDLERFSFDETRYINAHCDYVERVTRNSYYNRCYALPGNKLSIYNHQVNYGMVDLHKDKPGKITMVASDMAGNESKLEFWVKRGDIAAAKLVSDEPYNYLLPYDEGNMIQTEGLYLHLPKGTLYENLYMKYQVTPERSTGYYSSVHHLHDSKTPVHSYFDIGIRPTVSIPAELKPKVFVAYCVGKTTMNCGGAWKDGFLRTKVRAFGDYCIMADEVAPTIKPVMFTYNMRGYSKMKFRIGDNISTAPNVQGLSFEARVDGEWILMEYDKKTGTITHYFDEHTGKGGHELKLVVKDAVGNETVFEKKFVR
jgi:Peptidase family M23